MAENEQQDFSIKTFLQKARVKTETEALTPAPMIKNNLTEITEEGVGSDQRFLSAMAAVLYNLDVQSGVDKPRILEIIAKIDHLIQDQLDAVLHTDEFKDLESIWASIADLVEHTNFKAKIDLNLLDVTKEELREDLELNESEIAGSELFKKVYVAEYDQLGGKPYGSLIGLYDFDTTKKDIRFLKAMAKVSAASHAPFIASASPRAFGRDTMEEVNQLREIKAVFEGPEYAAWREFREETNTAYIGLTLPRYLVRAPYNNRTNRAENIDFQETVQGDKVDDYVWGSSAMLFARNMVKSFETSGWCQYLRGYKGGGLCKGLPAYLYELRGEQMLRGPVETTMPDFREYELAECGFIPLVHKKGTAEAVFYSAQAVKRAKKPKDPKDRENQQLASNLSYTFSVSRIAHYLKCIMRDNIGSSADAAYIHAQINAWISQYVTTIVNPDNLTLRYYPFKAYSLSVNPVAGKIGWYKCDLAILPHIQFEGMDVDLRVDARLG